MSAERTTKETIPNWELHHRIFCVKNYYKCGSVKKISEQFHAFFDIDRELHKSVIKTESVSLRRMGLRLTLIRNPLTDPAWTTQDSYTANCRDGTGVC